MAELISHLGAVNNMFETSLANVTYVLLRLTASSFVLTGNS